jgi:16S rRNA (cytosine1402-N4)-methyltransferase
MATTGSGHLPVMTDRVLALLAPALQAEGSVLLDATLGRAGHASALLSRHPGLTLMGVDADEAAIEESRALLAPYRGRVTLVHARYDAITEILDALGQPSVQGVLFDLGVSSPQLDDPSRGFAYSYDAPLDMRMDRTATLTAADVVNTYPAARLARVLREYGEERFARRIADAVVREREKTPLTSTMRLSEIIRDSIPAPARRTGGNPAKRTFQALRIEVNGELEALRQALPAALDALAVGGRIVVLAYHSLEDRMVKRALAAGAADTTPPGLPVPLAASRPRFRLLTRGAERPEPAEVAVNPRAASARLRAAERVLAAA